LVSSERFIDGFMRNIVQYRYFNLALHAVAWSIILSLPYLVSDAANEYKLGPLPGRYFTLSGIVHMIIFYLNALFLFPKLLNRRYWWLYIVSVVALLAFSIKVKFYMLETWFPNDLLETKTHVVFPSLIVFMVSVFYSIAADRRHAEKLQKQNEAAQLATELKFLRSQISPHFLFNTITNLVSLARKKSDQLETALLTLSELMRYMLYDAGKKISLQQEVDYLQSYIALQELRFGRDVNIRINIRLSGEEAMHPIEPMLLIPFVENAFKHGTGYPDEPTIEIALVVEDGVLVFEVKNKFEQEADKSKDESSGIGLSNVRSRLTLLYPDKHELTIQPGKNLFTARLKLKLV
jgi:two-component system, LytTR family, sensor kinase